jgi:hypothetical protein
MISAIIFTILGASLLIWSEKISRALLRLQLPQMKWIFGGFVNLDSPKVPKFYRWFVIFGGVLFLVVAALVFLSLIMNGY